MPEVLGRVTGAVNVPRGPDVLHRIRVPADWLAEGARIELELPRNLSCAACGGGGCDACERSGAISLRGRGEPPEIIEVALPRMAASDGPPSSGQRGVVVRIPENGGLPDEGSSLPRGVLMLSVLASGQADPGVRRVVAQGPVVVAEPLPETGRREPGPRYPRSVTIAAVIVIIWISLLILLRLLGIA